MPINYFISYSHLDQTLVEPVVKIIQLSESFVFYDKWSIPPGSTWEDEIHKGIEKADKVLFFWCWHSRSSKEISKEIKTALKLKKIIVPIRLDSTELPKALKKFQWIDFQFVLESHVEEVPETEYFHNLSPPNYKRKREMEIFAAKKLEEELLKLNHID